MTETPQSRNLTLDGLRALSILGVLAIHTRAWAYGYTHTEFATLLGALGTGAAPAFFLISGYLWGQRPHSWSSDVNRIISRLLLPYVVWSSVYLLLRVAVGLMEPLSWRGLVAVVFFGQAAWHLWFLPALAGCQVLGLWATTPMRRLALAFAGLPALLLNAAGTALSAPGTLVFAYSAVGWLTVFFMGVWLAQRALRPIDPWLVRVVAVGQMLLLGLSTAHGMPESWRGLFIVGVGTGAAFLLVADAASGGDVLRLSGLGRFGPTVFGVYLVQMMPIYALIAIWTPTEPLGAANVLSFWSVITVTSLAIAVAVRSTAFGRAAMGEYRPCIQLRS